MGLSQALSTAMSGLRATQASISLVGSNVANAETPGYVRKTVIQVAGTNGDYGSSVLLNGVDRQLDQYLQTQLRTETSGAAYADIRSTFLANLQNVYGNPAETGTIEDSFNKLLTAFQGLSTSPDSQSARIGAVAAAQTMAQTLNATTQGIQSLRANAEMGINDSIITANNAMAQIAFINNQLQNNGKTDAATASLLDQRDQYITQLSSTDGHQDRRQRPQPGDGIHELRRATGRHRGGAAKLQSAGHDNAQHPVQLPIRPRAMSAPSPSISRMAAATIWCRPTRSVRARSPPISNCATTRW